MEGQQTTFSPQTSTIISKDGEQQHKNNYNRQFFFLWKDNRQILSRNQHNHRHIWIGNPPQAELKTFNNQINNDIFIKKYYKAIKNHLKVDKNA